MLAENGNFTGRTSVHQQPSNTRQYDAMKNHNTQGSHKSSKSGRKVTFARVAATTVTTNNNSSNTDDINDNTNLSSESIPDALDDTLDTRTMTEEEEELLMTIVVNSTRDRNSQLSWSKIQTKCAQSGLRYSKQQLKRKYNYIKLKMDGHSSSPGRSTIPTTPSTVTGPMIFHASLARIEPPSSSRLETECRVAQSESSLITERLPSEVPTKLFKAICNFTISDIKDNKLSPPPENTPFTPAEVLVHKHLVDQQTATGANVNWTVLKNKWSFYASLYALENPTEALYNRSEEQLQQKYKDQKKREKKRNQTDRDGTPRITSMISKRAKSGPTGHET